MEWPFQQRIRSLVAHLVRGDYDFLERETRGVRLSSPQIAAAIAAYGRHLIDPPASSAWLDVVPHTAGGGYSVNVNLFTEEEGRSDLTLCLTVRPGSKGAYQVEIDDLRVL